MSERKIVNMKDSLKMFASMMLKDSEAGKIESISIQGDKVIVSPAYRGQALVVMNAIHACEEYCKDYRLTRFRENGCFVVKEYEPTVIMSLTKEEIQALRNIIPDDAQGSLDNVRGKLQWLEDSFDSIAE